MNSQRVDASKQLLGAEVVDMHVRAHRDALWILEKLERASRMAEEVTPEEAPEVEEAAYDERGMESIKRFGLSMYMEDPLTTANIGRIFVT